MPTSPSRTLRPILNDAGFTLLEIIAVLVIMGILAVVAVPRYFNLQAEARQKAMETAMAEAIGRVNGHFAQQLLTGILPATILYNNTTLGSDLGDFTLAVADGGHAASPPATCDGAAASTPGCLQLTVTPTAAALSGTAALTRSIRRPGNV